MRTEILRMEGITKLFPGVKALNNVSINVFKGEVLAIVGENGAGKSTLIKIIAGANSKDGGRIYLNEKEVEINSPHDSQKLGISIIRQEPNLIPNLSIADNIFLGREKCHSVIFIDRRHIHEKTSQLLERVGLGVDTETLAGSLSVAQRQMVEIARALAINSSLLIMDEPTASLTERETEILKKIIFKLKDEGVTVIFVSHRLNEVLEVADRIAVIRDGESMGIYPRSECNEEMLISLMAGRDIEEPGARGIRSVGSEILRVENISTRDLLKNISFTVNRGEILGFAGLIGSGRTELLNVIFGISPKSSGSIIIDGKQVEIRRPIDAIRNKIGLIPEERKLQSLIVNMSIKENISLSSLDRISHLGFIRSRLERYLVRHYMKRFELKSQGNDEKVKYLSGGSQQKVAVSKWLSIKPDVLMLDEPTKGIDVNAKREIQNMIRELANEGKGIIFVSSQLQELLNVCDRIMVIHNGMIKGELAREEATEEKILSMTISKTR